MSIKSRTNNIYDYKVGGKEDNKMVRKSEIIQKPRNERLDLNPPSLQLDTSNRRGVAGNSTANDYYILSQEDNE